MVIDQAKNTTENKLQKDLKDHVFFCQLKEFGYLFNHMLTFLTHNLMYCGVDSILEAGSQQTQNLNQLPLVTSYFHVKLCKEDHLIYIS